MGSYDGGDLTEDQLVEQFNIEIEPRIFGEAVVASRPITVLVGGQPGAGKTNAAQRAVDETGGSLIYLDVDGLRRFHPQYETLLADDPLRMPTVTNPASRRWLQMCVDRAHERGFSLVVERLWNDPEIALNFARQAKELGRETHANFVTVPPDVARMATLERYYRALAVGDRTARWVRPKVHDDTVANLPGIVARIAGSDLIDRFRVTDRTGVALYENDQPGPDRANAAAQAWKNAFARPLTSAESAQVLTTAKLVIASTEHVSTTSPEHPARLWAIDMAQKYAAPSTGPTETARQEAGIPTPQPSRCAQKQSEPWKPPYPSPGRGVGR